MMKTPFQCLCTKTSKKLQENIFKVEKKYKQEVLDFRTFNKSNYTKIGERDYSGEWESRHSSVYIYKLVDISINSFGFGWIVGEIDKQVKAMLMEVQQKIIESYDEWKNMTEEELSKLEQEMIQRFLIKID